MLKNYKYEIIYGTVIIVTYITTYLIVKFS